MRSYYIPIWEYVKAIFPFPPNGEGFELLFF